MYFDCEKQSFDNIYDNICDDEGCPLKYNKNIKHYHSINFLMNESNKHFIEKIIIVKYDNIRELSLYTKIFNENKISKEIDCFVSNDINIYIFPFNYPNTLLYKGKIDSINEDLKRLELKIN